MQKNAQDARTWAEYFDIATDTGSDKPVLAFPSGRSAGTGFTYYTPSQLKQLTNRAAGLYVDAGLQPRKQGETPLVIALFGYGTIEWAVRLGHGPEPSYTLLIPSDHLFCRHENGTHSLFTVFQAF